MTDPNDGRGTPFGGWRIGRLVSAGALAEVREAASPAGAVAAIKRLHAHSALDTELRAMFVAECALTCALPPHPGLVRGLHADTAGERPYLVMELVGGGDLRGALDGGRLSDADLRALGASAADGAAHLHGQGWVHGDLNPSNLILANHGAVICDLGIARRAGEGGSVRGTAAYMAPEQVRGEAWTGAVDVFALGVILWELSAGARLFHRGQPFLSMAAVVESEPPPLPDATLAPIVAAALARDPAARPSAAELAASLRG